MDSCNNCKFFVVGAKNKCLFNRNGVCKNELVKLFGTKRETATEQNHLMVRDIPYSEQVVVGKYALSIQASAFHYSSPKKTLDYLSEYKLVELAILRKRKKRNGENIWVDIKKDEFLKTVLEEYGLMAYWDGNDVYPVFAYVPIRLIKTLYTKIYKEAIK